MSTHDTDDERELFRRAMADVEPLNTARVAVDRPRPRPVPRQRLREEQAVLREMAEANYDPRLHEHGSELVFLRSGYQQRVLKRLRRGQLAVEGHLDLHGMNLSEAKRAVRNFILEASERGLGCVRIVHGKGLRSPGGEPIIKPQLAEWLRRFDAVIAFSSAPLTDGGTGAVYVALKRRSR